MDEQLHASHYNGLLASRLRALAEHPSQWSFAAIGALARAAADAISEVPPLCPCQRCGE